MSEHGHPTRYADEPKCIDIDPAVCLQPISHQHGEEQHRSGFIFGHDREGDGIDGRCEGYVATCTTSDRPTWTQTGTLEGGDLTLSPSILCRIGTRGECGFHGWVRDGKWVSA